LRTRLLLGAWAPGAFILALRISGDHGAWAILLTAVGLLAVVSLLDLLRKRSTISQQPFKLTRVSDVSDQVPGYLLAFVFPFLFISAHDWRDIAAYLLFVAFVALLAMRTDLVLVQPLLMAAGYRLYRVETTSGFSGILLSSAVPAAGQTIAAVHLSASALKLTVIQP
jgi:hypothetical protein